MTIRNLQADVGAARIMVAENPQLAAYIVRDYQELKDWGLYDLAWTLADSGYTHRNDVIGLLELIEKKIVEEVTE